MDRNIKEIYRLILNRNAMVMHCIKRKYGYDIHLEWEVETPSAIGISSNYGDDVLEMWVEKKLLTLISRR